MCQAAVPRIASCSVFRGMASADGGDGSYPTSHLGAWLVHVVVMGQLLDSILEVFSDL